MTPDTWIELLERKRAAALPLIEQMISLDEFQSEHTTIDEILRWKQIIWVSETMERHGWLWNGFRWTRTSDDERISLTYRFREREWRTYEPYVPGVYPHNICKWPPSYLYGRRSRRC
jgi:hypothetical protein